MASEKWEVRLKREFPFLKYPTQGAWALSIAKLVYTRAEGKKKGIPV